MSDLQPYKASEAPNIKFKREKYRRQPQSQQVFVDALAGHMGSYLNDTLKESPRVIEVGQAILDEMAKGGGSLGRTFMLGVLEDLDGQITVGTSGKQAGDVLAAVERLNAIHARVAAARKKLDEGGVLTASERDDLATKDPTGTSVATLSGAPDRGEFDRYVYRVRNDPATDPHYAHHQRVSAARPGRIESLDRQLVILDHVNCAAPQLLANRLNARVPDSPIAKLDARHVTEILWDRNPEGLVIAGVRYHHRQRVPSCDRCVNNLRIVVAKAARDAVRSELELGVGGLLSPVASLPRRGHQPAHVDTLKEQRRKEVRYNSFRNELNTRLAPAMGRVASAEDELNRGTTQDLLAAHVVPVRLAALRELETVQVAVYNERIGYSSFEHALPEASRDAIAAMKRASRLAVVTLRAVSRNPGRPVEIIVRAVKLLEQVPASLLQIK